MKYFLLLCVVAVASASVLHDTRRIDDKEQDEKVEKLKENLKEAVDKALETLKKNKWIPPSVMTKLHDAIIACHENNLKWIDIVNDKLKGANDFVKNTIMAVVNFINHILSLKSPEMSVQARIDQDEIANKLKEKLANLVKKIIDHLEEFKSIPFNMIDQMQVIIRDLHQRHVKWIDIINEQLKTYRGFLKEKMLNIISMIEKLLGWQETSTVQRSDVDEILKQKEEWKAKFLEKFDEMVSIFEKKSVPGMRLMWDVSQIVREGLRLGMDMEGLATGRAKLITGRVRDLVVGILNPIFGWNL